MRRVVFGGSFDPVHAGHLAMADAAQRELAPDLLSWVPSRHAPHKPEFPPARAEHRVAFLHVVVDGRPGEEIAELELTRPGPSYTVDTLEAFAAEDPRGELVFLAGADSLSHLATWRDLPRLLALTAWRFAPRPGWGEVELQGFRDSLEPELRRSFDARMLAMDEVDVSSSAIRDALRAGRAPVGLPDAVRARIDALGCYLS